ncbi:unnamed protein product, partial [Didymodactylos carnosus]
MVPTTDIRAFLTELNFLNFILNELVAYRSIDANITKLVDNTGNTITKYVRNLQNIKLNIMSSDYPQTTLKKVNVAEKSSLFTATWTPKIVGELNGQHVKLAKLHGEFGWHAHANEDEMFLVIQGQVEIQLRNNIEPILLNEGEFFIVPKGVEHNPRAKELCTIMLFEPCETI